jgi:TRAP-type mannitol/chloroaromatic compound transport system substrate-binding protein
MKKFSCILGTLVVALSVALTGLANAAETINWRLASTWAEGFALLESERTFAKRVEEMSGGRLVIKVFPAGQIAPANQVLDVGSSGAIDAGGDWPNYWSGRNTAFDLLGSHVMGFNAIDFYNWIYGGGGKKFYDEMYGKFNCVYFPHHSHDIESGFRASKGPFKSFRDFKGLKVRAPGLVQGRLIQSLGASPVNVALGEVYEAMQRGVVDACEISIPVVDEDAKITEVAKYWLSPGFHQTASIHGIMINKKKWEALPADLRAIVANAAQANHVARLAETTVQSARATDNMLASGVEINRVPEADLIQAEKLRDEIMADLARENPDYARILKHQIEFLKNFARLRDAMQPWSYSRNWTSYPDLP